MAEVWILHPSVVVDAWRDEFDDASAARRFAREYLATGAAQCFAPDTIEYDVLRAVALDAQGLSAQFAFELHRPVFGLFNAWDRSAALTRLPWLDWQRRTAAFTMAVAYGVDFRDANYIALAEIMGHPLLVSDASLEATLRRLATLRPGFTFETAHSALGRLS